jgi:hydroxymethylglutaryl-CoA lyase
MTKQDFVRIFEVGPRDGLQNEKRVISLSDRLFLIEGLARAGLVDIEVGSFVREDRVPQMAQSDLVLDAIIRQKIQFKNARAWVLVPNQKGLQNALAAGAKQVAVFTAASEGFNQKNIGMSVKKSLEVITTLVKAAKQSGLQVRGYVSTAFGCPYDGAVPASQSLAVISSLSAMGVDEISIGDTIGVATPRSVEEVVRPALAEHGSSKVAVHFHDTRGTALANTLRALDLGVRVVDSSAGGLGGCPFAPGATGNLATEDLVYMLHGMGMSTGVSLESLSQTSLEFFKRIGRPLGSRYLQACAAQS